MSTLKTVIFDLDDTLYSERAYVYSGFAAVAAAFEDRLGEREETADRMRRLFDTEHRGRVFNALLQERGLPEDGAFIGRMIDTYRAHRPTIALYPDAEAALSRLQGKCKLGLVTDGTPVSQWAKIDALCLRERMHAIIVTDELGPEFHKPHPRAFEEIARRLGAAAEECVYVADNAAKDFLAPNALGWTTIQVRRAEGIYRNVPAPKGGAPNHVIHTLENVETLLAR